MQKESAQCEQPARRKNTECGLERGFIDVLDVFSGQGNLIELISFGMCQASRDTCLEYAHQIVPRTLDFLPLGGMTKSRGAQVRHLPPF